MKFEGLRVGCAMTGSFCTFKRVMAEWRNLAETGAAMTPIMSDISYLADTRFGKAADFVREFEEICAKSIIHTIADAEPIGPKKLLDVMIIAPCTGNTLAKLAHGIADTPVTLAAKSHLRNQRPLIIAVSTNDGLYRNAENIGRLMAVRDVYFVPFGQDDCVNKPFSTVADFTKIIDTLDMALIGKQIQPMLL